MKKYILLLIGLLILGVSYSQNGKKSGQTKIQEDTFTYKRIDVVDNEEGNLSISGGNSSVSSKALSTSSAKSFSGGGSSPGIGETMGTLSVSLTGSAQYDIPIAVPTGINGVAPEVSLRYNSQSGNGLAGYGWNVSGISTISRIASTKFHDNQIDGVDFDALDRFALDGERLVLKSGTYGTNGAQYETETYSNLKIVSHGTSPYGAAYGPSYFIVHYPDGSLAHYGNSSDSRSRLNYSITYWQNPQGVRVSYEYYLASSYNSTQSISKIKYGSLNASTPINEIRFAYKYNTAGLERFEQSFTNGLSTTRTNILDNIEVYGGNTRYRRYNLSYNSSNLKYKRLTAVTELSGDGTLSHSPINFSYSNTNSSVNYNETTTNLTLANIEQRNAEVSSLDFTGNGKMDFIVYPTAKNKFWIFKDIQNSGLNYPYEVNTGTFETVFPTTTLSHNNKVLPGQGLTVVQNVTNNDVDFKVYSSGSSNPISYQYTKTWDAPTFTYEFSPTNSIQKNIPREYLSGDFNGDGLTDVLAVGKPYTRRYCTEYPCSGEGGGSGGGPGDDDGMPDPGGQGQGGGTGSDCYSCNTTVSKYKTVHFIDLKRDVTSGFVNTAGSLQQHIIAGDKIHTGDFNGDGKTDILHVTNGKLFVYTLTNNNTLSLLWQTTDSGINVNYPLLLGDYNGDGKTDFLKPTANDSYTFKTYLSTGTSFLDGTKNKPFKYQQTNWNGNNGVLTGYNLVPVDFNGDGKTDIIEYITTTYNNSTNGTQVIKIHNNLGLDDGNQNKETNIEFAYGGTATKTGNLKHYPIPIFLSSNQPNKNLEFAAISDKWITNFSFTQDHREDVLIRSISSNGVTQTIEYNNLDPLAFSSDNTPVYQDVSTETYPNVDLHIAPSTKVVSMLQRISSGTTTLKQVYSYYGATYNAHGLGFLGFKGVARSNWHTGYSDRIFGISKHDPLLRGAITDSYSMANAFSFTVPSSGYISKTTYQNASSLAGNKVFKLWQTSSLTQNALEVTNTNVDYIYDAYNNPTKITTNFLGVGSRVVDITYVNSTGSTYYIGRPTKTVETTTIGSETYSTETQLTYSGYLLTQKKTKGHNTPFDTEVYNYDTFGNVTKRTITPNGSASREIEFEFDSSGRYLTKAIDTEDLETTFLYNVNTGTLTKETNPYGQETNFTYDSWYRPTKVTDYLGNDVTTSYVESNYSYTVTNTGDDGSGSISIYDPLKRVTTVKEKDVLGQWVSVSYQYDKFDRVWKQSEPYTGSGASQWNEIEYDFYGRPIKQTSYTGKVTNISYSGLTVTVNDGTKTTTTTKNAMGNTISSTDPGGTINYTYFGNGNLKTANYNGVIVSLEQDGWGRKTKLTDPSAGIFTYAYNGYGEITNETTPKGATSYTYSAIGKLTQKQITGDNTNMTLQYGYNSTNKLISSISQVNTNGNNANYTYTYDSNERLISTSENNVHAQFTKQYTYDSFGRIDTEEYYGKLVSNNKTSTKKVKNTYQNGGLKTIKDYTTNEIISNLTGINARGQATSITMGNDLKKQFTYDAFGYLTEAKSEKNASSTAVELMKLTTSFNTQRGTLTSRTNSMFSWSESFTYDSMDRLINFNDNNDDKNNTYDLLGRITQSTDVGDYAYTGNSYQVNDVDLNNQGDFYFQSKSLQQVTYNAFKKPFEINQEGKEKIGFQYNAFMGRSHMYYGDTNSSILLRNNRKHYSSDGSMEISYDTTSGITTFVTYVGGDAYSAPAIWRSVQNSLGNNNGEYYYLHRDYLGSILMISDKNGAIKEKRHFDAWGNIVKLTDGNGENIDKFVYLDRGYTGHEHLQGVNLVHMNGRLYDPKLKRFLAPDNYIQDLGNTQNFNKYSYVLNNPLMYTDPSGEIIEPNSLLIAGIASAVYSAFNVIKENWGAIDNWATKNIFRPIQKWKPFKFLDGLFGKKRKSAPVEYANYEGLTSDPLASPSTNIPTSFFGGGGTDTGGLGVYWKGYKAGYSNFWKQITNTFSNAFEDPLKAWTTQMIDNGGWKNAFGPIAAYNMLYGNLVEPLTKSYDIASNFSSGNYYEAGRINGHYNAGLHLEGGLTLVTMGTIKGGIRVNSLAKNSGLPHFKPLRSNAGSINGWSFGRGYGAKPRLDFHRLGNRASKASNSMTIPNFIKNRKLLHYHRGKGNNLYRHRPWEKGWNDKSFWDRF